MSASQKVRRNEEWLHEVDELVQEARRKENVIVFIDGASKNNPGHCGIGISIEIPLRNPEAPVPSPPAPDGVRIDLALAMGCATNNFVEIKAIEYTIAALNHSSTFTGDALDLRLHGRDVCILSDSNWAINIVSGLWKAKDAYATVAPAIRDAILAYQRARECTVSLTWVKAHDQTRGNIRADELANVGAAASARAGATEAYPEPRQCEGSRLVQLQYELHGGRVEALEL
jgi:ribonuclease HI